MIACRNKKTPTDPIRGRNSVFFEVLSRGLESQPRILVAKHGLGDTLIPLISFWDNGQVGSVVTGPVAVRLFASEHPISRRPA